MKRNEFIINHSKRDYQIFRHAVDDDMPHAHFNKLEALKQCLELILDGKRPKSQYFRKAAQRLLTEEEYNSLRDENVKQKYVNKKGR